MTTAEIDDQLERRGYILESDCMNSLTLTSTAMTEYIKNHAGCIVRDPASNTYALYNLNKYSEEQVLKRLKHKQAIASFLCAIAKQGSTIHYRDLNAFLNTLGLDYFENSDIRYLIEEISSDFQTVSPDAVLTAVLVKNTGLPGDGFWTLADVIKRNKETDQKAFHDEELRRLHANLQHFDCCP